MQMTSIKPTALEQSLKKTIEEQKLHILHLEQAAIQGHSAARRNNLDWDTGNDGYADFDETVYDESTTTVLYASKKKVLASSLDALSLDLAAGMAKLQLVKEETKQQEEALEENSKALKTCKKQLRKLNIQIDKAQHKVNVGIGSARMDMGNISHTHNTHAQVQAMQNFHGSTVDNSVSHNYYPQPAVVPMSAPAPQPASSASLTLPDRTRHSARVSSQLKKKPMFSNLCKWEDGCELRRCSYVHPHQIEIFGQKLATLRKDPKGRRK